MPEDLLTLSGVRVAYGNIEALKGVDLRVGAGEIVALIGANGAGKSTTLRAISRLMPLVGGSVSFAGEDLARVPAHAAVGKGLVQVPEGRRIFARMSVLENLQLGAYTRHDPAEISAGIERAFALFPALAERRHQAGGTLSGGEQQMLAIARALMTRPKLLLMDEPSMGVAPILVQRIFATISQLNAEGLAILLVEQNARQALGIAHRAYVLETGRIALGGVAKDLLADSRVQAAYLGG
ncbi:MAG: ABC transporter ATP-binding protein [Planctomycetota bacterium]